LLSLQPPFYPSEAAKKGATPSQYGFVFGIANLAAFLFAPIFGRYGAKIGPKLLYNAGAFTQGIVGLSFGFLVYIDDVGVFLGLSYLLR
jgi:MFS family permease